MSALTEQIETDIGAFLNTAEWGEPALFGGSDVYESEEEYNEDDDYNGTTEINVMFDEASLIADPVDSDVMTTGPVALAKTSDLTGVQRGSLLVIRDVEYFVQRVEPEEHGMTAMVLSRDLILV